VLDRQPVHGKDHVFFHDQIDELAEAQNRINLSGVINLLVKQRILHGPMHPFKEVKDRLGRHTVNRLGEKLKHTFFIISFSNNVNKTRRGDMAPSRKAVTCHRTPKKTPKIAAGIKSSGGNLFCSR
jgi:hypothetical protein